ELLLLVGRSSERVHGAFGLERVPRDECFLHESPVELEHLQAIVGPIGYIDQVIVSDKNGMDGVVEALRRRALNKLRARRELDCIVGLLAVCAPVAFVGASVGVKNNYAAIEVTIGDKELIRLCIDEQAGRTAEILRIVAAAVLTGVADLHEELAVL